ncbi:MAG: hypothetical protein NT062_16485 [Proteobacteria bacterium]|nr:hypothetical protein [Pseudomonadota bacterium]
MRQLIAGALFAGALVLAGSGCTKVFMQSHDKTVAAKKNNDVAYLTKVCNGEIRLRVESDKREACAWLAATAPLNCETLVQSYADGPGKRTTMPGPDDLAIQLKMAKKFLECGKIKETFELVVQDSYATEGAMLIELEDGGEKVEDAWVKYLQENKGAAFMEARSPESAMGQINKWLEKKHHVGHCTETIAAATGASELARVWVMPHFSEAQCTAAAPLVADLLLSENSDHRLWACNALGTIGSKAVLAKVQSTARRSTRSAKRAKPPPARSSCARCEPRPGGTVEV